MPANANRNYIGSFLTVRITNAKGGSVTFAWDDADTCRVLELGEHDLQAIMAVRGHEGADVPGYTTELY